MELLEVMIESAIKTGYAAFFVYAGIIVVLAAIYTVFLDASDD